MNHSEKPLEQEFREYTELLVFAKALNSLNPNMDDISLALKSVSTIGDLLKKAANAADAVKNADLIDTIASLKLESATLKTTLVDAKEENLKLREENLELKEEIKIINENNVVKAEITKKDGFIFSKDDPDNPCCPNCWNSKENRLIRLLDCSSMGSLFGHDSICPKCNRQFTYKKKRFKR